MSDFQPTGKDLSPIAPRLSVQEVVPLTRTDIIWIDLGLALFNIFIVWPATWLYMRLWPQEAWVRREDRRWLLRTGKNRSFEQRVEDGDIGWRDRMVLQRVESDKQWATFLMWFKPRTWWRAARGEPLTKPEDVVTDEDGIPWL